MASNKKSIDYIFTYKGIDYDVGDFVKKHPGGQIFLHNIKQQRKDITEYFKSIHSEQAEKQLLSFKQVGKKPTSKETQRYFRMLDKVKHLYQPNWLKQICLVSFVVIVFVVACVTTMPFLSITSFCVSQVLCGWCSHSMIHSRNQNLRKIANLLSPTVLGLSCSWWKEDHNMHHMFTNSMRFDHCLKHQYYVSFYPFLYLKWRLQTIIHSVMNMKWLDLILIPLNYYMISRQKLVYFMLGVLTAGFYTANILIGIHERQKRYNNQIKDDFIEHHISTCRNFGFEGIFWLILMGGMQYQTQHHLFPQIPFYNLPSAKPILAEELRLIGKQVKVGNIMSD